MRESRVRNKLTARGINLALTRIFLLVIFAPSAVAQDNLQQTAPKHVVLLLRNRNVIEGELIAEGEIYRLRVSQGEVFVPQREVAAIADSVRELYEQERSRSFGSEVEPHLELAIWCAEHGLEQEARSELSLARLINPRHPGIPLATRRVEMALLRNKDANISSNQSTETKTAQGTSSTVGVTSRSATPLGRETKPAAVSIGLPRVIDPGELFRGLPQGTGEQFVRVIHPIINHYCATAGCHGGPKMNPSLRLLRVPESRPPLRGEIAQNLQTVLSWIDFNGPGASPLLKAPTEPHGGLAAPVFSGTDMKQYRELVNWVYSVTRRPTLPPPTSENGNPEISSATRHEPPMNFSGAAGIPLDGGLPLVDNDIQQVSHNSPPESAPAGVVSAAGSFPIMSVVPANEAKSLSPKTGVPEKEQPLIPPGRFLRPTAEGIPAIRWSFANPQSSSPQSLPTESSR
ncbi:MAG: hypothetical protein ACUVQR_01510 [Thermogutta sp.]